MCSRDLDRLAKLLATRQKEQKGKRESWAGQSSQDIWRQLVAETKRAGRDHAAVAEIYSAGITARCTQLNDDITRIYKKVRGGGGAGKLILFFYQSCVAGTVTF